MEYFLLILNKLSLCFFLLFLSFNLSIAQEKAEEKKLSFNGGFRIRLEQDWNSQKSDGTYRDDRFRLRYLARFGMKYQYNTWASFGIRLRTGFREKQQDPHLTLGEGFNEFSTVPIGFDKLYFRVQYKWLDTWIGKNTFPFEKRNELFWSDNVNPEGIFGSAMFKFESGFIQTVKFSAGHFILRSNGSSFSNDEYFQGFQVLTTHWDNRLRIFPSYYFFNKMPNIPDGNETYTLNYKILHLGMNLIIFEEPKISFGLDLYQNVEDLQKNLSVPEELRDQKKGLITNLSWGKLTEKDDFMFQVYYAYLERFAAVDFLAQNDWARWDYSSQGSPDGRLTNFKGLELLAGYMINKNFRLKMRYFVVDQLVPYGISKENGNRIRLDLDIRF
jgi:hypothetical protein